ncbi:MAG: NUDIX hydrolase [Dermatophilaceae bacterium]
MSSEAPPADPANPCHAGPCTLASVILVDDRGWLLLQERDEYAPVAPEQWGLVGGHVDPGEDIDAAAYRELAEETGLAWDSGLAFWRSETGNHAPKVDPTHRDRWNVYVGSARGLTDADIVCGEGRAIVFVDPVHLDDNSLDLEPATQRVTQAFVRSTAYLELAR